MSKKTENKNEGSIEVMEVQIPNPYAGGGDFNEIAERLAGDGNSFTFQESNSSELMDAENSGKYDNVKTSETYETTLTLSYYNIVIEFFKKLYQDPSNSNSSFKVKHVKTGFVGGAGTYPEPTTRCFSNSIIGGEYVIDAEFQDGESEEVADITINIHGTMTKPDNKLMISFSLYQNNDNYYKTNYIVNKLVGQAIYNSHLKGEYVFIDGELNSSEIQTPGFSQKDLNDVFMPEDIMKKIRFYYNHFERTGEIMNYLLSGPPGTGKTEGVKALSTILKNMGVTVVKTTEISDMREKFKFAGYLAPSVIIMDDLDMFIGNRSKGLIGNNLQPFLDCLDGFELDMKGVGVIATTNSNELLDLAAQRPGRFHKTILTDRLEKDNIKNIILKSLHQAVGIKDEKLEKTITDDKVLEKLFELGFTGARIHNIVEVFINMKLCEEDPKTTTNEFLEYIEQEDQEMKTMFGGSGFGGKEQLTDRMDNDNDDNSGMGFVKRKNQ